jgi:hypothetical protein
LTAARAVAEQLVDVGRTPPANTAPVLWCDTERKPTVHRFDGFRPLVLGVGEVLAAEMFQCCGCSRLRQWGLQ